MEENTYVMFCQEFDELNKLIIGRQGVCVCLCVW